MNEELTQLLRSVIREELVPVHERLDRMDGRLDRVEGRLDRMEGRLDQVESRLDRMESEQQIIKQAVLETNEAVQRLEAIQEQQHRIIEMLSARSIEHELR
ncbi:hypothetical protein SD70_03845 [Gordoniibacillus kamchatkensis]|uniref:Uncharacterized protein n=1 Tax=Gordoniibacillus kamchatkensis TaxID=1590651 RepID=A0ABR5AMD4_9BACL|nr:hypothetical protein SD70_03845 [Paenibacillus sp. VKM B-2647]